MTVFVHKKFLIWSKLWTVKFLCKKLFLIFYEPIFYFSAAVFRLAPRCYESRSRLYHGGAKFFGFPSQWDFYLHRTRIWDHGACELLPLGSWVHRFTIDFALQFFENFCGALLDLHRLEILE